MLSDSSLCCCSSVVVNIAQEHHVGEVLGAVFPTVADQSRAEGSPDTGNFLKQVSGRSLWICTAHASSEPLLSCLAEKGQCLCWLCYARQVGLEPRSPRFQHLYQRFTAMLWDSLIVLLLSTLWHFPMPVHHRTVSWGRCVSGILDVSSTTIIRKNSDWNYLHRQ